MGVIGDFFRYPNKSFTIGPWSFTFSISGLIEIILFAVLIYYLIVWVKKTKAWALLKGIAVLLAVYLIALLLGLDNIVFLFKALFGSMLIAVIIIFQPEIRRALEQLGERNIIRKIIPGSDNKLAGASELTAESIDKICLAMASLGKGKVGALVVVERKIELDEYIKTGIAMDADISAALLEQIFVHNTPLHDGAVIIRGNKIVAATCYLPLSDNEQISKELGTRHRAGLGISEKSDCITLIASEETGNISVAVGGVLKRVNGEDALREILNGDRLTGGTESGKNVLRPWKGRRKHERKN